jgi:5-carboxymethyl-2-hydroxymuconate isomerase
MPHTILEYSSGMIPETFLAEEDGAGFFCELHLALGQTGIVELTRLKGRYVEHRHFVVGDGGKGHGFVFLQLALLSGRSADERAKLRDIATSVLERWLKRWNVPAGTSVTIEVREIDAATHQKIPF